MRLRLGRTLPALGFTAVLGLMCTPSADAALILSATVGGVNICASDNDGGCGFGLVIPDADPTLGSLALGGALGIDVGGLNVRGSLHTQTIGPPENILNSSSLIVTNTSGADVSASVAVGATDFVGPSSTASFSGSGTWELAEGSIIDLVWCNDPGNEQGGEEPGDCPGTELGTFSHMADSAASSFSFSDSAGVADPDLFSMALTFDFTLVPGGRLVSRGQTVLKPTDAPEPVTLALIGIGLVALGARARRRSRR